MPTDDVDLLSFDELMTSIGRPWYRYGLESPLVLIARFKNAHPWWFRLRMAWQRARRGYDDQSLWNLDSAIAKLVVVGTTYMLENGHGHPMEMEPEEWDEILETIRDGFQGWLDADGWFEAGSDAEWNFGFAQDALAEWFGGLWD